MGKIKKEVESKEKENIAIIYDATSRNAMMLIAKDRGIKNFRILNKNELMHILSEGITQQEIDALIAGAVARWKSGWGSKKVKESVNVK